MIGPEPEVIAGRFELLGPLARGNMGEVYRARDLADGDTVAVKLMRRRRSGEQVSLTEADNNATRFAREVRIMRRLSSENPVCCRCTMTLPGRRCCPDRAGAPPVGRWRRPGVRDRLPVISARCCGPRSPTPARQPDWLAPPAPIRPCCASSASG
jgi:serine/threonine protein kinase